MFGYKEKIARLQEENSSLTTKIFWLERELEDSQAESRRKDSEIENMAQGFAQTETNLRNSLEAQVYDEVKKQRQENEKLRMENAVLKKEAEILNKAFENMGFDAKDTKHVIDKLVEGLSTKNTVNVVK